ncbi:hypothetical protein T440DRAFT_476895 [Plenodomus tracheiphilus IPT5]|uniref:Uncharacterized protein n=1 Tax=Plenodomus tracheiphilus IPT5 TaxID=1408161 RepID=A0A6A7BBZ6_9PLEO|nr:hypothetical protein T440DRAFT_476895 [Plenodomus tracheiphilus IPT5]
MDSRRFPHASSSSTQICIPGLTQYDVWCRLNLVLVETAIVTYSRNSVGAPWRSYSGDSVARPQIPASIGLLRSLALPASNLPTSASRQLYVHSQPFTACLVYDYEPLPSLRLQSPSETTAAPAYSGCDKAREDFAVHLPHPPPELYAEHNTQLAVQNWPMLNNGHESYSLATIWGLGNQALWGMRLVHLCRSPLQGRLAPGKTVGSAQRVTHMEMRRRNLAVGMST